MEGWLNKKGQAESTMFGRRNWKRFWCVMDIDMREFTYYEGYDLEKREPKNKRGSMSVSSHAVKAVDHHERSHVFTLRETIGVDSGTKPIYLQADTKREQVFSPQLPMIPRVMGISGPITEKHVFFIYPSYFYRRPTFSSNAERSGPPLTSHPIHCRSSGSRHSKQHA